MMDTGQHTPNTHRKTWSLLIAVVSGLLFPLISIIIITVKENAYFTFRHILRMHFDHPELFVLYLLPAMGAYLVHLYYIRQQKIMEYFQSIIKNKNEMMNQNARIAAEMGKGNYSIDIVPQGKHDVIGQSLLVLKENLLARGRKESLQNWISEGKNMISNVLRLYHHLEELGEHTLEHLIQYIDAVQGAIYLYHEEQSSLEILSTYACHNNQMIARQIKAGYGLVGQCAHERELIYRTEIPDDYFTISSGLLGEQKPASLLIAPLITEGRLQGVIEIAFLSTEIPEQTIDLVNELGEIIARTFYNLRLHQNTEKQERLRFRMQSLSENSLDMIFRLSLDGRFYYANPVVEDYLGRTPAELINQNIKDTDLADHLKVFFTKTILRMEKHPKHFNAELTLSILAGEKSIDRIIKMYAIPEFIDHELETVLIIGHDITESKRIVKEIQEKNRNIEDSIQYAQKIQSSILPGIHQIQETFPNCFVYYKPCDVISGDFPWYFRDGDLVYLAAVDCTGHGVTGALLSLVGYFLLNSIVLHRSDLTAGQICDELHGKVRKSLKQETEKTDTGEGLDLAFCRIDLKVGEIQYAGANRPLLLLKNGRLTEFKGDGKIIGGIPTGEKPESPFTYHSIPVDKGDKIFFFTDGMPNQLGGPENKKYTSLRIRNIIKDNSGFSLNQYEKYFIQDFEKWMQHIPQIDDVLLIGIEF